MGVLLLVLAVLCKTGAGLAVDPPLR